MTKHALKSFEAALQHALAHAIADQDVKQTLRYLETKTGNRNGCIGNLRRLAMASAMSSWFCDKQLDRLKQLSFLAAKLDAIHQSENPEDLRHAAHCFHPLLSDHEGLLHSFSTVDNVRSTYPLRQLNVKYFEFTSFQYFLALRSDWKSLCERSLMFLEVAPRPLRRYVADHEFFVSLSKGDKSGMEAALKRMVSDLNIQRRYAILGAAAPFAEGLVDTNAVILAKIAWRNGYEVEVDSPLVPNEWLPIAPLAEYPEPYEFMKSFNVGGATA